MMIPNKPIDCKLCGRREELFRYYDDGIWYVCMDCVFEHLRSKTNFFCKSCMISKSKHGFCGTCKIRYDETLHLKKIQDARDYW